MVNEHSQWHADLPTEHSDEEVLNPEKVLVLFASETGNAQDTAERVGREIRRRGGRCTVQSMEDFDIVRNLDLMTLRLRTELIEPARLSRNYRMSPC